MEMEQKFLPPFKFKLLDDKFIIYFNRVNKNYTNCDYANYLVISPSIGIKVNKMNTNI